MKKLVIIVPASLIFLSVFISGVILFSFHTVNKPAKILPKNVNQFLGLPTAIVEDMIGDQPATKHGYIVKTTPDQENSVTPQVQIRGLVSKWTSDKLLLQINNEFVAVNLPEKVELVCVPKTMPGDGGQVIQTTEAFIDMSKTVWRFNLTNIDVVKDKIPAGSPVGVMADSMAGGLWLAIKVLGFGCNN